MRKRARKSVWAWGVGRQLDALTSLARAAGTRALARVLKPAPARSLPSPVAGSWTQGVAIGATGARRFRLFRPPRIDADERLPLMVMLHGCGQDANSFAASTRMNQVALRERFLVLYPEQDRRINPQGCWNWYDTDSGRADGEVALILNAIDQVCLLHPVDGSRVAVAGLSAGASMAALLATRHPGRFKAVVMHSGVPPGTAHSGLTALGAMRGRRATAPLRAHPTTTVLDRPPLLAIHGDADTVVSPRNSLAAVQAWTQPAGAQGTTARTLQRGRRRPMSVADFKQHGRTVATLVIVHGLAHAWSGGAARHPYGDAHGPDASRLAWAFAARQFRRLKSKRPTVTPR